LLYRDCGLKGLSAISNDMRGLQESADQRAVFAVDYFVDRAGLAAGMLAEPLGGLDVLAAYGTLTFRVRPGLNAAPRLLTCGRCSLKERTMPDVSVNRAEGDVDKLVQRRFFRNQNVGIFIDVGAANPDYLSVSALYRSLGWRIVAIEPNPAFCEMHRKRGHDILQYACGDRDEDDADFCVVDSHGAPYENGRVSYESFSSLAIKEAYTRIVPRMDVERIKVKLRRLDTILAAHAPEIQRIDILSVDVEGWELEVLAGLDFRKYRPKVLVIENLFDDPAYRARINAYGYVLWKFVPPNDIYVAREAW
jgi:FkbM family methyltransferase